MSDLVATSATQLSAAQFVGAHSTVLTTFDHRTQDSGNVSWLVLTAYGSFFCKSAGEADPAPGRSAPYFDHPGRIALLRNAIDLARSCASPVLATLRAVVETSSGPLLVYDAAPGELVHVPRAHRTDPTSSYQRFAHADPALRLAVFDQLLAAHCTVSAAGWVACDLYDGCLLVDFETGRLTLIDLDTYRRGPFTNTMGRMFGSSTFMAPEEFRRGARIDRRTTVFTLGRLIRHFGTGLTEDASQFCGNRAQARVVQRACAPDPAARWAHPAEFAAAWDSARTAPDGAG